MPGLPMDFLRFFICKSRESGKSMEIWFRRKTKTLEAQKYKGGMNLVKTTNQQGSRREVCGLKPFPDRKKLTMEGKYRKNNGKMYENTKTVIARAPDHPRRN